MMVKVVTLDIFHRNKIFFLCSLRLDLDALLFEASAFASKTHSNGF